MWKKCDARFTVDNWHKKRAEFSFSHIYGLVVDPNAVGQSIFSFCIDLDSHFV